MSARAAGRTRKAARLYILRGGRAAANPKIGFCIVAHGIAGGVASPATACRRKFGDVWRYEYEVLPENDPHGILQLEPGPDVSGVIVVDATLPVVHHPRIVVAPVDLTAFVEYGLVDGARP